MNGLNNPMQLLHEFNRFKQNFNGDPRAEVERLIASGQMTQAQLNQLQNMAQQFQNLFNIR